MVGQSWQDAAPANVAKIPWERHLAAIVWQNVHCEFPHTNQAMRAIAAQILITYSHDTVHIR
jgi:hypothetical protein